MAPLGNGQYQFSSQPNSVLGGFFPLDPPGQFPIYGAAGAGPGAVTMVGTRGDALQPVAVLVQLRDASARAHGCKGDQYLFPPSLMTTRPARTRRPTGTPRQRDVPDRAWYPTVQGWYHDSWFTDEARYLFNYNGAFSLQFYGDDDMFVFINGVLVVDLGRRPPAAARPRRRQRDRRDRDHHRGRLAQRGGHDDSPLPVGGSVHRLDDEHDDQHRRQRPHELHQRHLRLPHAGPSTSAS